MMTETGGAAFGSLRGASRWLLGFTHLGQRHLLLPLIRVPDLQPPPDVEGIPQDLDHCAKPRGRSELILDDHRSLDELAIPLHARDHEELQVVGPAPYQHV